MSGIFESLTAAVEGAPHVALAAALVWGVLSIVLSPCHLASIPLIVGFIQGRNESAPGRAALLATLFATGILITIAIIGAVTAAAGRMMGDVGTYGNLIVGVIFILVGMALLDIVPLGWTAPQPVGLQRRGALAALVLGLVFGIALGPCTFAYMAPMLAVTFRVAGTSPWYGAALLAAYGVGHCLVIAVAGSSAAWTQRVLDWNADSAMGKRIKWVCGVLVVMGGLYMLYTAR
ncbi:MAG: cytochrome c biogenesis protein CcdA [Candidatus Krumholzibacteria bacterium]|nr:cytochrome c biogenesis protein CcdA [Candidatus Krumholzibacteria bacterium]